MSFKSDLSKYLSDALKKANGEELNEDEKERLTKRALAVALVAAKQADEDERKNQPRLH